MRINSRYVLGGVAVYVGVTAVTYRRLRNSQSQHVCQHETKSQDGQAFSALADTYDKQIGWDETLMGITLLRRWLMRQAKVALPLICLANISSIF